MGSQMGILLKTGNIEKQICSSGLDKKFYRNCLLFSFTLFKYPQ